MDDCTFLSVESSPCCHPCPGSFPALLLTRGGTADTCRFTTCLVSYTFVQGLRLYVVCCTLRRR